MISASFRASAVIARLFCLGWLVGCIGRGKQVIEDGYADAVAFSKQFIANPDLVERIAQGAKWNRWDEATFYTPGAKGYTDYPTRKGNGFQDAPQERQDHG